MKPVQWNIYVRTLGHPVPLSGSSYKVLRFRLSPLLVNREFVVLGDDRVYAAFDRTTNDAVGRKIWPGTEPTEWIENPIPGEPLDLSEWFVDARIADEGVEVFAYRQIVSEALLAVDTAVAI